MISHYEARRFNLPDRPEITSHPTCRCSAHLGSGAQPFLSSALDAANRLSHPLGLLDAVQLCRLDEIEKHRAGVSPHGNVPQNKKALQVMSIWWWDVSWIPPIHFESESNPYCLFEPCIGCNAAGRLSPDLVSFESTRLRMQGAQRGVGFFWGRHGRGQEAYSNAAGDALLRSIPKAHCSGGRASRSAGWGLFTPLSLPLHHSLPEFMNFKLFGKTILVVKHKSSEFFLGPPLSQ